MFILVYQPYQLMQAALTQASHPGQQGCDCIQYHVRRWAVSAISSGALEVPQDGGQQTVRIHARNTSWRPGAFLIQATVLVHVLFDLVINACSAQTL